MQKDKNDEYKYHNIQLMKKNQELTEELIRTRQEVEALQNQVDLLRKLVATKDSLLIRN